MNGLIFALITCAGGVLVAVINAKLSSRKADENTGSLLAVAFLRQLLNIAYLTAVFFVFRNVESGLLLPLIGAALGLTIPSIVITAKFINRASKGDDK